MSTAKLLKRIATGYVVNENGCWVWQRYITPLGYGRTSINGKSVRAHRLSYELHVGPIPDGLGLDHLCRNRACVNPAHLEPVTQRENLLRGEGFAASNAVKTHCPRGHEYTPENTILRCGGRSRFCRTCNNRKATV